MYIFLYMYGCICVDVLYVRYVFKCVCVYTYTYIHILHVCVLFVFSLTYVKQFVTIVYTKHYINTFYFDIMNRESGLHFVPLV